ncbi:MAG: hypothetical protein R3A44_02505 [Caldilineaceae bacterium]
MQYGDDSVPAEDTRSFCRHLRHPLALAARQGGAGAAKTEGPAFSG